MEHEGVHSVDSSCAIGGYESMVSNPCQLSVSKPYFLTEGVPHGADAGPESMCNPFRVVSLGGLKPRVRDQSVATLGCDVRPRGGREIRFSG